MKIQFYKGKGTQPWRWRLVASNGKIIADSAEGYASRGNVIRAINKFMTDLRRSTCLMIPVGKK